MSELTDKLISAAQHHKGTDLGGLLQWAVLHIQAQDEALTEALDEALVESAERIRLEGEILLTRQALADISDRLLDALPVRIDLARDYAPHKNIMAMHGVEPYAKKQRKPKAAPPPPIAS